MGSRTAYSGAVHAHAHRLADLGNRRVRVRYTESPTFVFQLRKNVRAIGYAAVVASQTDTLIGGGVALATIGGVLMGVGVSENSGSGHLTGNNHHLEGSNELPPAARLRGLRVTCLKYGE